MATTPLGNPGNGPATQHTRSKSSVLRSFIGHKRNNSDGTDLPSSFADSIAPPPTASPGLKASASIDPIYLGDIRQPDEMRRSNFLGNTSTAENGRVSPTKSLGNTLRSLASKDSSSRLGKSKDVSPSKSKDASPTKPKKSKSSTNLATFLSRPKSLKNLNKIAAEEEAARSAKDKENRTPPSSMAAINDQMLPPPPPIFAQFSSQQQARLDPYGSHRGNYTTTAEDGVVRKPRPMSYQPPVSYRQEEIKPRSSESRDRQLPIRSSTDIPPPKKKGSTWGRGHSTRPGLLNAFPGMGSRTKSATAVPTVTKSSSIPEPPVIDPKDIDTQLEAMLDRRNIPENQRYKMRNLTSTIKMEFIRQDWAETAGKLSQEKRPGSDEEKDDSKKKKHGRGRSLTLSRAIGQVREKSQSRPPGPTKKKSEGTLGRHFRSKSSESVNERTSSSGGGILAKIKNHVVGGPLDYVSYLRKVQKPELVEVGKLHKLRLLLRNETVAWAEEFIREGGMKEIVDLLHRIMDVEWREEHEDALLHENLLCLKALCTTGLALQYLHSIHCTLFPALLHMIFDPEKKGPSEFTTRNIITSVLLTYIEAAVPGPDRTARAKSVLGYLRDPDAPEEEKPVSFVLQMRRERPYRVWCKEVVSVTKEVFWIFLHNLNVIALEKPAAQNDNSSATVAASTAGEGFDTTYMATHFPRPRAPVPAAPYVGGVEWDATNYLASHLDLLNAILACTPSRTERNELRHLLQISGWERCLGGSLRLCKEKFYGAVHEALRAWVAAAFEDGWNVRDVRYGPPPEQKKSRSVSPVKRNQKEEAPPRLDMPRLDFGLDVLRTGEKSPALGRGRVEDDLWLS